MADQLERIKAHLSFEEVWHFLDLRGTPHPGDQHSPLRHDKRPSFTIYRATDGRLRFYDHGTGEGGDQVDLWRAAKGFQSVSDAVRDILSQIPSLASQIAPQRALPQERIFPIPKAGFKRPPGWRVPTALDCRQLARLRPGISACAFDLAVRLGTLKMGMIEGLVSWILTDLTGLCAEARRLDGQKYRVNGQDRKGECLTGSRKDIPLGLVTLNPDYDRLQNILLVEGLPDYFAGLELAINSEINFRVAAILGANCSISLECSPFFHDKIIVIIPHNDDPGQKALPQWVLSLYQLGAQKIVTQRLDLRNDDLADFLQNPGTDNPLDLLKGFNAEPGAQI